MEWFMNLDPIVQVAIVVCMTWIFISIFKD